MDAKSLNFSEISNIWLDTKEREVKKTTLNRYRTILNNHLIPMFNFKTIEEINNEMLMDFINGIKDEYKYHILGSIYNVLREILVFSGKKDVLKWRDVKVKKEKYFADVLSETEGKQINKTLKNSNNPKDLGILLALNTGARIGEICGIRWEDINLDKRSIFIRHTVQRISINDGNGAKTKVELLDPKSEASIREIAIPKLVFKVLLQLKEDVDCEQAFLLSGREDKIPEPRALEKHFKKQCINILGRCIKFHNLRHTFASISISNNVDVKTVQWLVGV